MDKIKKEFMEKYGRLDWSVDESADKVGEGKRYEGLPILMNIKGGTILCCDVIEVNEKGFKVKPISVTGMGGNKNNIDYNDYIPFDKFFHVFII